MYLSQACKPRQSVFDRSRTDVVLNISDLLEDRINCDRFFEENYITAGMGTLIDKAFGRLENTSSQAGTFLLAQAMGGGKTHSMIALGLLTMKMLLTLATPTTSLLPMLLPCECWLSIAKLKEWISNTNFFAKEEKERNRSLKR
ncbi:MAG TPA: hypothetical protein V6C71_02015 [Coleofasciculaceae cyanobacterium]|jgi:hypothetical protein